MMKLSFNDTMIPLHCLWAKSNNRTCGQFELERNRKTGNWKGIEKVSNEELWRAILSCQNENLLVETGVLCLKIQETFVAVALKTTSPN